MPGGNIWARMVSGSTYAMTSNKFLAFFHPLAYFFFSFGLEYSNCLGSQILEFG